MQSGFPRQRRLLAAFDLKINEAEINGVPLSDMRTLGGVRRMLTTSLRKLEDIKKAMRQDADLKLPREVMLQILYVISFTRKLLSRIEDLRAVDPRYLDQAKFQVCEDLYDDVDPQTLLGKKID